MLDLQQLRCFVAVAEAEHVGRAAHGLGLSPSPLSRQVRQLELRLGSTLFDRTGNRLRLTAAGRALLRDATALLAHADRTEQRARDIAAGRAGALRVGYVAAALHAGVLPRALAAFSERWPAVRLELEHLRSAEQLAALEARALDVGLTHQPTRGESVPSSRILLDEPFVLAMPAGHPLSDARGWSSSADVPLIAPPRQHAAARDAVVRVCQAAGLRPDVRFEASEPHAVLSLVAAGLGVAVLQRSFADRPVDGVEFRPLGGADRMLVYVTLAPGAGAAAQQLADLILAEPVGTPSA